MTVGNTEAAIAFLQLWEPGGPWHLTAIEPDTGKIDTRPLPDPNLARRWIDRYQCKRNIYFSPNRVRAASPAKPRKLTLPICWRCMLTSTRPKIPRLILR